MNFPGKSILTNKRVIDSKVYLVYDLHGFRDIRKLNAFMVLFEIRVSHATPDNPNPTIFESTKNLQEKLGLSERLLKEFKADLEKRGLVKRCRTHIWKDGEWRGTRTCLQFQDAGIALYWKIKSSMNGSQPVKPKKAPVLKYTDKDMENAKFWFKCLRRYWRESVGKLKQIGAWERQKETRANAARIARQKMGITAEEFMEILKRISICRDAEFYFKNILGPNTFNKKWKNGLTAAEAMRCHVEELDKEEENQKNLTISRDDVPVFLDLNDEKHEDIQVSKVWDAMWDIIGGRLRTKFKTEAEANQYLQTLYTICDNLEDFINCLDVHPGQIYLKDSKLRQDLAAERIPDYSSYFYFLLDKYSTWNGPFSQHMLLEPWMEFWRKVWRISYGEPTEQDLEQFSLDIDRD